MTLVNVEKIKTVQRHIEELNRHAEDILNSEEFKQTKAFIQHGNITVMEHSMFVAAIAVIIGQKMPFHVSERNLVRGALLHDYFLYDWHDEEHRGLPFYKFYRMHGFMHPYIALENAKKDFGINEIQEEIIKKHMWPLTVIPPLCREAWIVTFADKYCAIVETLILNKKNAA